MYIYIFSLKYLMQHKLVRKFSNFMSFEIVQQKTTRETEIEKFVTHRYLGSRRHTSRGSHGEVKTEYRWEKTPGLGHVLFY